MSVGESPDPQHTATQSAECHTYQHSRMAVVVHEHKLELIRLNLVWQIGQVERLTL
jgi:hypothetical protein